MDEIDCFRVALKNYVPDRGGQSNLSLDAHISEGYISQIINGKRNNPSRRTMIKIAGALKTTYQDMIALGEKLRTGQGEMKTAPIDAHDNESLLSHTVKMQDIRIAELQKSVDSLNERLQKLTDDMGQEFREIKRLMIETARSGDYHRLDPTRPYTRN